MQRRNGSACFASKTACGRTPRGQPIAIQSNRKKRNGASRAPLSRLSPGCLQAPCFEPEIAEPEVMLSGRVKTVSTPPSWV